MGNVNIKLIYRNSTMGCNKLQKFRDKTVIFYEENFNFRKQLSYHY